MKLKRVELHGFRGFRDYADIPIPDGFLVIQGPNGAGKSTVFDAVEFSITGNISKYPIEKSAKESVEDYLWWRGDSRATDHYVRVHFATDRGEDFVITRTDRGCDRTEADICKHLCTSGAPDNALQVLSETALIRDESISQMSLDISETQRYQQVQRALGAIQSRNLSERVDVIENRVAAIHRANAANEERLRNELTSTLSQLSEARAAIVEDAEIKRAEDELRALIPDAPQGTADLLAAARNWVSALQADTQFRLNTLSEARRLLSDVRAIQTPEFMARVQDAESAVGNLENAEKDASTHLDTAQRALDAERSADKLASALAALLDHGEELGLREGHCPLCDSIIADATFRDALAKGKERLAKSGADVHAAESRLGDARQAHTEVASRLETARAALATLKSRIDAASNLRLQVDNLVQRARAHVRDVDENSGAADRIISETREQSLYVEQRLRTLENSRVYAQVRELEEKERSLRSEVERLATLTSRSQRAVATAKQIQHAITRTAGELLDERLALISPLLSELFLRLKPHADWRNIEYRIRGDVRRFLSLAVGSDLNPQFVFSSGQRRITGLAFLLSVHLARHWCNWRTLMLDDPVQHIDDYRALNLVEVLSAIRRDGRQIICAVEDAALANVLCRRLGTNPGQKGALLSLDPGPSGVAVVKSIESVGFNSFRILDRVKLVPNLDSHVQSRS